MSGTRAAARFPPLAIGLVVAAWVMLLAWDASPYGRYLNHGDWTSLGLAGAICAVLPGGQWMVPLVLYGGGWVLMSAAMMLPTTLPLVRLFDRMIAARADRGRLHALLITGYLLAWSGFGVAAHLLDLVLHWGLGGWDWLAVHAWVPGAMVLAMAGAFQFSALKYHCLDKCRTPLGFMMSHWHGPRPAREALTLGVAHGIYCVGCCWALMLLMFVVGTGNIGWMFALGLVMALEKNHPWGRHLAAPLGVGLIGLAGLIVARGLGVIGG
jgi:predicted metal-binding membrane protein